MSDIRTECAKIIATIFEDKVFFAELKKQIPEKDLPFANMLILTTLRYWHALEAVLKKYLRKKIPNKHRLAEYLLKLAAAELLFMDTAPHAVINQTVQNIKHGTDRFLGGMANAILRQLSSQKNELLQEIENISLLPPNFLPILQGYSAEQIKQISQSLKHPAPLDITVKASPTQWQEKFSADLLPNGTLRLYNYSKIQSLPDYNSGQWWVQDVAASLPVTILGNIKGKKVIDLCAAPGGKTAQLAAKGAQITAIDISAARLQTLRQNMQRLGFDDIITINADALQYMQTSSQQYDIILLDAPCSATGTFRRHPEVLHIKSIDDVNEQAKLQRQMLENCTKILSKNGILVYSVCSISKTEGEQQIADFLADHPEYIRHPITYTDISSYAEWNDNLITSEGEIRTLPYYLKSQKGMDAFFICKLQRII